MVSEGVGVKKDNRKGIREVVKKEREKIQNT